MPQSSYVRSRVFLCGVLLLGLTVSIVAGYELRRRAESKEPQKYQFLAKRLGLENPNDIVLNFVDLRHELNSYVAAQQERIGLYFEYLPTGTNITVNAADEFFRASLVKLPVVMRAYRLIEDKQLTLTEELTITLEQLDSGYGTLWKLGAGTKKTVSDLIRLILVDSDNTAFNVLYKRVNVEILGDTPVGNKSSDDIYDYLDIPRAGSGITPMITPKNYTSILKSLFFSSYLTYEHSNEILRIMTEPHSLNLLRSAVRPGIQVANKSGEYMADQDTPGMDLNVVADCGLIFYPDRPYALCIMIHANDRAKAITHIQHLSRLTFAAIERAK